MTVAPTPPFFPSAIGLFIIGDEILSGKRQDKHLPKVIELLAQRGLALSWVRFLGDDRAALTAALRDTLASDHLVFSCGGIGATPDDHTRQAAAAALGAKLVLHPEAQALIEGRMRETAQAQGLPFEPDRDDHRQRLQMGVFPEGAEIIPNPYNRIPGFRCLGHGGAQLHFVPGFPVMAWPMIEWVLDTHYPHWQQRHRTEERSVIVFGAIEAVLTPLMEAIEAAHPGVKVFSLPSVDHPEHGRHIELGVKGETGPVRTAYDALLAGLRARHAQLGPELVR